MADYEAKPNSITVFDNAENVAKYPDKKIPHIRGGIRVSLDDLAQMPIVMAADKDGKMHRCVDLDVSLWSKAKDTLYFWAGNVKKKYVKGETAGAADASYSLPHTGRDSSQYSDGTEFFNQEEPAAAPPDTPENDLPF